MNNRKTGAIVVLVLLALGGSLLLPGVAGAGKKASQKKGLAQRVEVLEGLVADLMTRVEELEEGGGSCACSCDVLHLTPLADFPENPSEGDLCVVDALGDGWYVLCFYVRGDWHYLTGPPPRRTPDDPIPR